MLKPRSAAEAPFGCLLVLAQKIEKKMTGGLERLPLRSMQLPFSDITLYTRPLAAGQTTFTETFSGVPPSTSAIIIALRSDTHGLDVDREQYALGGSDTGIKSLQVTAGQFVAPTPSYSLNFPRRAAARGPGQRRRLIMMT